MAASVKPMVLSLLRKQDSYGYEIIKNVRELSALDVRLRRQAAKRLIG